MFLRLNGRSFSLTRTEALDLVMRVAEGLADLDEIAAALTGEDTGASSS